MSTKTVKQFFFYGAIGVLGSVIDLAVFGSLQSFALAPVVSQWGAAAVGNTHNHFWHFFKVFDHDQGFSKTYTLTLILAVVIVIASGPLLVYMDGFIGNIWASKLLLFPLTGLIGFVVRKVFIFRKGQDTPTSSPVL